MIMFASINSTEQFSLDGPISPWAAIRAGVTGSVYLVAHERATHPWAPSDHHVLASCDSSWHSRVDAGCADEDACGGLHDSQGDRHHRRRQRQHEHD